MRDIPDDVDRESYLRGVRHTCQYFQLVGDQLLDGLEVPEEQEDVCPDCGAELVYDPSSGDDVCLNNHE